MQTGYLDQSIVNRIVQAVSIDEAWQEFVRVGQMAGFDKLIFGSNRLRRIGDFGNAADSFFLSNLPDALMSKLVDDELYRSLPVAIWAMKNKGVISLIYGSELYHKGELPEEMAQTQKLFMDAGIKSGFMVSFNEPGSLEAAAMALISTEKEQEELDAIWEEKGSVLQSYASLFNLRVSSLPVPLRNRRLTARQKEVLTWIAQGKTTNEIATILGLSVATIEKHLRHARDVFGVSTSLQAVLYAQITAQIFSNRR